MNYETSCRVYERISTTDLASNGIRPGGVELTERALAYCRFPVNSRILDVGCGTGVTLDRLIHRHEFSAIGIDASGAILGQSRAENPTLPLVRAIGDSLPFPDACADAIIAECSLSVMVDPYNALTEFHRVLKDGARLILTDVYARNPAGVERLARMPVECCLRGAVSRDELMERLTNSGFTIELWEDHSDQLTKFAVSVVLSYRLDEPILAQSGLGIGGPRRNAAGNCRIKTRLLPDYRPDGRCEQRMQKGGSQ